MRPYCLCWHIGVVLLFVCALGIDGTTVRKRSRSSINLQPRVVDGDIQERDAVYISGRGNMPRVQDKSRFASRDSYDSDVQPRYSPVATNEILVASPTSLPRITFREGTVIDTKSDSWPMAGPGTRPLRPGYRHPAFRAINGISVDSETRILNQSSLDDDRPDVVAYRKFIQEYNRGVWTHNNRTIHPNDTDAVARAVALARNSFIVVDVQDGFSRMHVIYLDPTPDRENRSTLPWRARLTRFGLAGSKDLGSSCTGLDTRVDGIPTSLVDVAALQGAEQRFEHIFGMLSAMYSVCKNTVLEALTLPNDKADIGLLHTLHADGKPGPDLVDKLKLNIETWFNNVPIHYEASPTFAKFQEDLSRSGPFPDLNTLLWRNIRLVDQVIRNNTDLVTARVLPGNWQAYFGFLGVRDWLARNKALRSNVYNILYIGMFESSVLLSVRVGETRVKWQGHSVSALMGSHSSSSTHGSSSNASGPAWFSHDSIHLPIRHHLKHSHEHSESAEESSHEHSEESSLGSESASFLEIQSQAKGNVSLVYPLNDNPGTLYCKSFFGVGSTTLMAKILKWHIMTLGEALLPGDRVLVPCLAKGVRIERQKLKSDAVFTDEICFATHRKYSEPFESTPCEEFSRHKVLVQALGVKNVYFEGTSDHRQCKAIVQDMLRGSDGHRVALFLGHQFANLVKQGGPLDMEHRLRIKHIPIASDILESAIAAGIKNKVPFIPKYAPDFGVTMEQALTIFQELSGPYFGSASTDDMGPGDWVLPLVGAFGEVLLRDKLQFDETWLGRVYFHHFNWIHGMKEVWADVQATKDTAYQQLYNMVAYRIPTRKRDPEDMPAIDNLDLVPSRGFHLAHPEYVPTEQTEESARALKKAIEIRKKEVNKIITPKVAESSSWVTISGQGGSVKLSDSSRSQSGSSQSRSVGSGSHSGTSVTIGISSESEESGSGSESHESSHDHEESSEESGEHSHSAEESESLPELFVSETAFSSALP